MTLTDALVCPACHHRDHDPGGCGDCPRCELHFDEAVEWLARAGYVIFEGREALTEALAEATVASRNHLNWQIIPARKRAGIIVDYLLPEANHA
jgi:hypothetical protein